VIRRLTPALVALAVLASGCNSQLGRAEPACGEDVITSAITLSAQSVRGAEYVPCIRDLKPGWKYEHLVARSGQTQFWLSSDRVGDRFLEVTLEGSCDLAGTTLAESDEPGIELHVGAVVEDYHVLITVVPEGDDDDHENYAAEIVAEIGATRIDNRLVEAIIDDSDLPTAERIRLAVGAGRAVLAVGARDYEERTVELHVVHPGETMVSVTAGLDAAEAVEEVAAPLGEPEYRAVWHYVFGNGCVTYRFDASGAGVERIEREVKGSLGFTPLGPLREYGEQIGYIIP